MQKRRIDSRNLCLILYDMGTILQGGMYMSDSSALHALRERLKKGDVLRSCGIENNKYVVHLTKDPAMMFEVSERETVARILHEESQI